MLEEDENDLKSQKEIKPEVYKISNDDICYKEKSLVPEPEFPIKELLGENENADIMLINYLLIGAIKINLTIRLDLTAFDLESVPGFLKTIMGVLGNSITRITDCPLKFTETANENIYKSYSEIQSKIIERYTSDGIKQIYKILGSIDILGNPVKFIESIGTGFIELVNEPRKGFAKGPSEFGKGLGKGIASFFGHIVEGGFSVIGSMSGSLLSSMNTITGTETYKFEDEEDEPANALAGTASGFTKGAEELGKGFTNLYYLPKKMGEKEGTAGIFKGIGLGLLGLILAPVKAVLQLIRGISVGIKNTAGMLTNKPLKTVRFRHPRVILDDYPLQIYDPNLAEAREMLIRLQKEDTNNVYYSERFVWPEKKYVKKFCTAIVSETYFIVVYALKKIIVKCRLTYMQEVRMHRIKDDYVIYIKKVKNGEETPITVVFRKEFSRECVLLYDTLEEMIKQNKEKEKLIIKRK